MVELHSVPGSGRSDKPARAAAEATLTQLDRQANDLRSEITRLRRDLAELQHEFSDERAAQLLEANETLVLRSLEAETLAEHAVSDLGELTRAGQRDPLTDTPNRALMLDRLENAIASARRRRVRVAVLFLDVDGFKQVNDTLGHPVGDAALRLIARRLESVVREMDTVGRHSGDEFLVLLAQVSEAADAAVIVARMLAAVAAPGRVGDHDLRLSVSIGVAVYPEDGEDAQTLVARADAAMYRAKKRGQGGFEFHDEAMSATASLPLFPADELPPAGTRYAGALVDHEPRMRDLREANEQLLIAALNSEELESSAGATHRQQIHFLAMVAHELRNPLTPIRMAAEVLTRTRENDPLMARQQLVIKRQVAYMSRLVDDLLDGSRVSAGKFRLERSAVEIAEVLNLAVESCRPAIEARRQEMTMELPPGPLRVHGDPLRLIQVFGNLLDNASKYTPKGGSLRVALVESGDTLAVTVSDNGLGISAEALPNIFDLFVQDPRAVAVDNRGLGIGLAVVRNLVQAHGGSVVGSSAGTGQGSEFVVTLPIASEPRACSAE